VRFIEFTNFTEKDCMRIITIIFPSLSLSLSHFMRVVCFLFLCVQNTLWFIFVSRLFVFFVFVYICHHLISLLFFFSFVFFLSLFTHLLQYPPYLFISRSLTVKEIKKEDSRLKTLTNNLHRYYDMLRLIRMYKHM